MNDSAQAIVRAWHADTGVLLGCVAAAVAYGLAFRGRTRWAWFGAALAAVVVAELSPIRVLADGVLFSAHMAQHLLLLLIAPALFVLSVPEKWGSSFKLQSSAGRLSPRLSAALGWPAGVGAMWLWHVPFLCDSAVALPWVRALQTVSLLALGTLFWWPILARDASARLNPALGVGYLFTACLACSALGILITLTPLEVCSAFASPAGAAGPWGFLRARLGTLRDRQIGGLLMWVPMCLVYVSAIMLELARWFGARDVPSRKAEA